MCFRYGLGGFILFYFFVWVIWGVLTNPERINHMPICCNLAGNQIGQNYDE